MFSSPQTIRNKKHLSKKGQMLLSVMPPYGLKNAITFWLYNVSLTSKDTRNSFPFAFMGPFVKFAFLSSFHHSRLSASASLVLSPNQ